MCSEPATDNKQNRRQLLLQTAEALFARKGIDAVSLNEINKAARQRNTSAMHYHFGSKEGLVQANHLRALRRNRSSDQHEAR